MTESLKQFLSFVVSVLSLLLFDETEANTAYEIRRSENLRSRSTIDPFRFVTGNNRALREWQSSLAIVADHGLPVEAFPLGLCQGNCNVDNDCSGDLYCYKHMGETGLSVPGCMGTMYFGVGYCIKNISPRIDHPNFWTMPYNPTGLPILKFAGNDDTISNSLDICEADCDTDADCRPGLVCFHPDKRGQHVPGCWGDVSDQLFDHCIDPAALEPTKADSSSAGPVAYKGRPDLEVFQLKFYWEPGYFWKMTFFPTPWCFNCVEDKCFDGEKVQIYKCMASATRWRFRKDNPADDKVQLQVDGTNVCLQSTRGQQTILKTCNATEQRQKYTAGQGDFQGDRFELVTKDRGCLSMHHEPKEYELILKQDCNRTRQFDTSYLVKASDDGPFETAPPITPFPTTMLPMPTPITKRTTLAPIKPTNSPTRVPTRAPTKAPTSVPTKAPTKAPTSVPTKAPTKAPTSLPTAASTLEPTSAVPASAGPTVVPTDVTANVPTSPPTSDATSAGTLSQILVNGSTKSGTPLSLLETNTSLESGSTFLTTTTSILVLAVTLLIGVVGNV